jgi:hypothetical protein
MRQIRTIFFLLALWALPVHAQDVISLTGLWDFAMGDKPEYNDDVMLPGSMLTNEKGHQVSIHTQWTGSLYDSSFYFNPYMEKYRREGEMKFPFFLTPNRHYTGRAWYRKSVYVPRDWRHQRVFLFLERPHIETTVYVNGHEVGHQMSLSTPHEYEVTRWLETGQRNEIAICVYNGIENVCVGQDSHSVTDQTQGNWNGIVGRIELQAKPAEVCIRNVRVYPDMNQKVAYVLVKVESQAFVGQFATWAEAVIAEGDSALRVRSLPTMVDANEYVIQLDMSEALRPWDEFSPNVYQLRVYAGDAIYDTQFGMRQMAIDGSQLLINGRPIFLRGTLGNCCFPETGYPPTDEESWERVLRKCKEYGINHIRFHSYCPPEAAFSVADRLGLYLQPEGPSWPNHGVKLRRGMAIDQYLLDEGRRIVDTYGNHPSFVMMAAGNEPAGDWVSYCRDWVKLMKKYDPSRIYCGASVGGGWAWDDGSEYHVKAGARGLDWDKHAPHSDDDYYQQLLFPRNYKDTVPNHSPIVAHEQGQWCAFPDLKEVGQYTGVYKARNFEIFSDLLSGHGMAQQAEKFLMASGHLQVLCYKYEIERNLRTREYAGFQLLGLNDYSGQGSALVGPLNVHWREKGYCTATDWTQFCNSVVPLARFPKFVFTDAEVTIPVDVYNAWREPLKNVRISCRIDGAEQQSDQQLALLPIGRHADVVHVSLSSQPVSKPQKRRLVVSVTSDNAPAFTNSWEFWVYPQSLDMPQTGDIYETDSLDQRSLQVLQKGGTVLLTAAGKIRYGNDVKHQFLPVFWNTSWFKMRPPHTTGAYIQSNHPVFRDFPTDDWQNLNWWELTNRTQVMNLSEFPADYQPIVQPIDTWHVSRKLGMLLEARVLKGRLLMTTMDITNRLESRPVARQLRYSILRYMQSADFNPTVSVSVETLRHLFEREAQKVDMFTNESPDELKPKLNN